MRRLIATIISLMLVVGTVLLFVGRPTTSGQPSIRLSSNPFPLLLGPTTLLVAVSASDGTVVENAQVVVSSQMMHEGMLPINGRANTSVNGVYYVPITWPMAGQWLIDVTASLPDGGMIQERFEVYVFSTYVNSTGPKTYQSTSQYDSLVSANPHELWIVIPLGTQTMLRLNDGEDIIPEEIRLSLKGQNTLVIRNDDLADHTVGPFFIRSGETIRQTFTSPATYKGTCSIRLRAEVNIVVET